MANEEMSLEIVLRRIVREEVLAALGHVNGHDRMLTAEQAAELMACSSDWLYRRAKKLPFVRRVGRMLRFSEKGIIAYLEAKKPSKSI
jgi:excisionase family DNA binding protein